MTAKGPRVSSAQKRTGGVGSPPWVSEALLSFSYPSCVWGETPCVCDGSMMHPDPHGESCVMRDGVSRQPEAGCGGAVISKLTPMACTLTGVMGDRLRTLDTLKILKPYYPRCHGSC